MGRRYVRCNFRVQGEQIKNSYEKEKRKNEKRKKKKKIYMRKRKNMSCVKIK
jgi:hypothetical protein